MTKRKAQVRIRPPNFSAEMEKVREACDRELDAKQAAARGLVDAILTPENLRDALILTSPLCAYLQCGPKKK